MSETPPTRGFTGRPRSAAAGALPPGQYDVGGQFPVLSAEPTPVLPPERATFTVEGLVATPRTWSLAELLEQPPSTYRGDIHCVTTWSKLGTSFGGVGLDVLLEQAGPLPGATHVVAWSHTGYTTNLPLADVTGGRAWVVWTHEGNPLTPEHGGPARLVVPHLYFWKSVKWVAGLRLLDHDEPGFWETHGYHDRGDPWREQRYEGD